MKKFTKTRSDEDARRTEDDSAVTAGGGGGGGGGGVSADDPAASKDPMERIDAQNPPQRMGGFLLVPQDDSWRDLMECAEMFFQPHVGCSCRSCHKRRTRDQLCDAIQTMKQSTLG